MIDTPVREMEAENFIQTLLKTLAVVIRAKRDIFNIYIYYYH